MMNYLVTGGMGFIGTALVKRLAANPENRVYVIDDLSRGKIRDDLKLDNVDFFDVDIRDRKWIDQTIGRNIDVVFHLAFINGTENFYNIPDEVLDVAIRGMQNVLEFAEYSKTFKELVLVSSSEVYQNSENIPTPETQSASIPDVFNPRFSYASGKLINEMMAIHQGKDFLDKITIVRPYNVYGPAMGNGHVIPQLINKVLDEISVPFSDDIIDLEIQSDGTQTRSFVYIDDFIDGLMLVHKEGIHMNAYNIGTEEERDILSVVKCIGEAFGKKINIIPSSAAPEGGVDRRCPDISKMRALGFDPIASFPSGIMTTVNHYQGERNG
jgi:nucleoside-diphosphate-sugar epimerase